FASLKEVEIVEDSFEIGFSSNDDGLSISIAADSDEALLLSVFVPLLFVLLLPVLLLLLLLLIFKLVLLLFFFDCPCDFFWFPCSPLTLIRNSSTDVSIF